MAYVKVGQIKSTPAKALAYISRADATSDGLWVSTNAAVIDPSDFKAVARQFQDTIERVGVTKPRKGSVLAHHVIQSFDPKEQVDAETAHRLGVQLAERVTGGSHEYMIATHFDKGHVHNHIIFNAVNFETGRKFRMEKSTLGEIRSVSDELCRERGLSVMPEPPARSTGRSMGDLYRVLKGESAKEFLRTEIDKAVTRAQSWTEFEAILGRAGIEVSARGGQSGTLSFREITMGRAVRDYRLGAGYTEASLMARMSRSVVNMVGVDASMIVKEGRSTLTVTVPGTGRELRMTVAKSQIVRRGRSLRIYVPAAEKQLLADRQGNLAKSLSTQDLYRYFAKPALSQLVGGQAREARAWNEGLAQLRALRDQVNARARWMPRGSTTANAAAEAARSRLEGQYVAYQSALVAVTELVADPARGRNDPEARVLGAELRVMEREISTLKTDVAALEHLLDTEEAMNMAKRAPDGANPSTDARLTEDDLDKKPTRGEKPEKSGSLAAQIEAQVEALRRERAGEDERRTGGRGRSEDDGRGR